MALTFEHGGDIEGVVMAMKTCFTLQCYYYQLNGFFFSNLEGIPYFSGQLHI